MPDNPTCPATNAQALDAAKKTVLLAFDLADDTVLKSPALLTSSLQGKPVQDALKRALEQFILPRIPNTSGAMTEDDAKALLKLLEGKPLTSLGKDVLDKIGKTQQFKDLKTSLDDFLRTASCAPLGVWVNEDKTLLIVSGIVLAVGGTTALFLTKTNNVVTNFALGQLKDTKIPVFKLGTLSGAATFGILKPEIQEVGLGFVLSEQFKPFRLDLKLGATGVFSPSQQVGKTVVAKSSVFTIDPSGGDPKNNRISLGLSLSTNDGKFTASVGAILEQNQGPKGTLDANLKLNKDMAIGVKGVVSPGSGAVLATFNLLDF